MMFQCTPQFSKCQKFVLLPTISQQPNCLLIKEKQQEIIIIKTHKSKTQVQHIRLLIKFKHKTALDLFFLRKDSTFCASMVNATTHFVNLIYCTQIAIFKFRSTHKTQTKSNTQNNLLFLKISQFHHFKFSQPHQYHYKMENFLVISQSFPAFSGEPIRE